MKNTFGNNLSITIFGESHGKAVGAVLDGICPGIKIDESFIASQLDKRRPKDNLSTARREPDNYEILSGVFNGYSTGTPITIVIPNTDVKSSDYDEVAVKARPGHADYTAHMKYHGFEDYRGGGHFSGRLTSALVAAGAIVISALKSKGIEVASHIKSIGDAEDRSFENLKADMKLLSGKDFAVLDDKIESVMKANILKAKENGDSAGGCLETVVTGMPAGVGEPWFDSMESMISHAVFSIPAVKGIEFGDGFKLALMNGSSANDSFEVKDGKVETRTNHNGGINGGITNGMPIIFKTVIKPTPTIGKEQDTINLKDFSNTVLAAKGRHDPCIVQRARIVIDSITAIALYDMLCTHFGTDWFRG